MADTQIPHPMAHLLRQESVDAFAQARARPGEWVVWQSGFPHARASKTQAYRLRKGLRQRTLTEGHLDHLVFRAFRTDAGDYQVHAMYNA